jgi:hypothetical protein
MIWLRENRISTFIVVRNDPRACLEKSLVSQLAGVLLVGQSEAQRRQIFGGPIKEDNPRRGDEILPDEQSTGVFQNLLRSARRISIRF